MSALEDHKKRKFTETRADHMRTFDSTEAVWTTPNLNRRPLLPSGKSTTPDPGAGEALPSGKNSSSSTSASVGEKEVLQDDASILDEGATASHDSNNQMTTDLTQLSKRPAINGGVQLTIGAYPRNNMTSGRAKPVPDARATVMKMWENFKKMMGFSPECKNGGYKDLRGDCICPPFFEGNQCERIICINNGTRSKEEKCRCPYPEYISGRHCEFINCANGGKYLGNGTCQCVDPNWYTGQFCQNYTTSWLAAIGLPLICIAVVILCCVVCRMDFCPRRRSHYGRRSQSRHLQHAARQAVSSSNQRHAPHSRQPRDRERVRREREQEIVAQENILNEQLMRYLNEGRQYVVRLEPRPQSAVLDPIMGLPQRDPHLDQNTPKPWSTSQEPPPSYEQATGACAPPPPGTRQDSPAEQPPDYSLCGSHEPLGSN